MRPWGRSVQPAPIMAPRSVRRGPRHRAGYAYILLAFVYLAVFVLYPMVKAIWMSLTATNLLTPNSNPFVGLSNYETLFRSGTITPTLIVSAIFVIGVSVCSMVMGVVVALMVESLRKGKAAMRTILALPWTIPSLVIGLLFALVFDERIGVVNRLLALVKISPVGWLTSDGPALFTVILVTVWNLYPFVMLVTMAALQGVPAELRESAAVDGAGYWQTARRVVVPTIAPTLMVIGVFLVIWAFQQFQAIWIMTEGGPINGTDVLTVDLYKTGFLSNDLGSAAAIGVITLIPAAAVTVAYFRLRGRGTG